MADQPNGREFTSVRIPDKFATIIRACVPEALYGAPLVRQMLWAVEEIGKVAMTYEERPENVAREAFYRQPKNETPESPQDVPTSP